MAELAPEIQAFRATIETIVVDHAPRLGVVGGNLLIRIFDGPTWTIVTKGERLGVYDEATDDEIDFALACDEDILLDMLTGEDIDLEACVEQGYIVMDGDYQVYERFMGLARKQSMLDVRSAKK